MGPGPASSGPVPAERCTYLVNPPSLLAAMAYWLMEAATRFTGW
jgi:hypothetical protein